MKTKTCTKCGIKKESLNFPKDKNRKDALSPQCTDCYKTYYQSHKQIIINRSKIYQQSHKEERKIYMDEYNSSHKNEQKNKRNQYTPSHKKEILVRTKKYRQSHKEETKEVSKKYYQLHKQEKAEYNKKYRSVHKNQRNNQIGRRKKIDINYKIRCNLRSRICMALKKNQKSLSTMFLIGCEVEYLMYHLQSHFIKGMTWDSYGEWHIDHIKPCCSFDLSKSSEQKKCFHYTNLQPLWAIDNYKKGGKYRGIKIQTL